MKIYPASQAIYYMNICFFIASVGYSYQFRPGANDSTICRKDGTLRTSEPRYFTSCHTFLVVQHIYVVNRCILPVTVFERICLVLLAFLLFIIPLLLD